jgi:hypothetical protein
MTIKYEYSLPLDHLLLSLAKANSENRTRHELQQRIRQSCLHSEAFPIKLQY